MNIFLADNELVERLQEGNIEAFDLLYQRYSGKLYSFSLKFLKSAFEAEELVQSVFLKVWKNHKRLRKETYFKSYLFTIAYHDICKLYRKRYYWQKFVDDTRHEIFNSTTAVEEGIDFQSVLDHIQKLIASLPDRQRSVFLKSRKEHKSTKEIASELGLSTGTIDNYISATLRFIRGRLKKEDIVLFVLFSYFF